jgi:hypothetical protein
MNGKTKNILFYLTRIPVLFVYISFLTVQLTSNFDVPGNGTGSLYSTASNAPNAGSHLYVSKDKTHSKESRSNIRLNKRFQPEEAIYCIGIVIKIPFSYLNTKCIINYSSKLISSFAFNSLLLRGPPVLA